MKIKNKFIDNIIKQSIVRSSTIIELLQFLWQEKLWWITPLIALLLIIGAIIIFAHSSPVAPFLYTIF